MQVSGETMIFRNAHEGRDGTWYTYATGVSSKKQDGTYANAYLDVRFRKGVIVEHKTKINITNGFLTVREFRANGGDVQKRIELMVLDFELADGGHVEGNDTGFAALNYDDVPF
jgi:hypothetical protein